MISLTMNLFLLLDLCFISAFLLCSCLWCWCRSIVSFSCLSTDKLKPLHKPRLCHIKERGDGKGFGFNLQAEKGKPGQYIGKVDPGSPAEAAGLRDGDRLVEVNGVNVENSSHEEVVTKIRLNTKETKLLVIEKEGYEHYHAKGVVVTSGMLATSVSRGSSSSSEHSSSAGMHLENSLYATVIYLGDAEIGVVLNCM